MSSWLRLDADFLDDARLWDAGWEATLVWPALLALLKQHDGVLDDRTFSARYLSRKIGCPDAVSEAAIAGIRGAGLLVQGSATWKVHQGIEQSREGWLSPKWADKRNAPPSWEFQTLDGLTVTNHAQPSRGLDVDGPSLELDALSLDMDSRAGADAHAVTSRLVTSRSEQARENDPALPLKAPKPSDSDRVWASWRALNTTARKTPTAGQRKTIRARLKDYSVEELGDYFRWLREAPHKRAVFCRTEGHDGFKSTMLPGNCDERMTWVAEWKADGSVRAVPSKAAALTETDGSARLSYQSWSWFEGELSARAIELGFTPEQVSAAWAKKHKEAANVPSWVFERAVENVRKERE